MLRLARDELRGGVSFAIGSRLGSVVDDISLSGAGSGPRRRVRGLGRRYDAEEGNGQSLVVGRIEPTAVRSNEACISVYFLGASEAWRDGSEMPYVSIRKERVQNSGSQCGPLHFLIG